MFVQLPSDDQNYGSNEGALNHGTPLKTCFALVTNVGLHAFPARSGLLQISTSQKSDADLFAVDPS